MKGEGKVEKWEGGEGNQVSRNFIYTTFFVNDSDPDLILTRLPETEPWQTRNHSCEEWEIKTETEMIRYN